MPKARSTKRRGRAPARKTGKPGPPKVFLSHASEDKARFVVDFATRLRERGIDVWFDRWEMLPGDSLVRKIFDEGLARADAVIVVISKHSIAKRWVREELDAAMVKKINTSSKLIPVVIDDCPVPQCLQATIWEKISDLQNYEPSLKRIVLSIFGQSDKPPVGARPAFSSKPTITIGDLTRVDSLVLQSGCEACLGMSYNSCLHFTGKDLIEKTRKLGISDAAVWESVDVLVSRGFVKVQPGIPFEAMMEPEPGAYAEVFEEGRPEAVSPHGITHGRLQITFSGFDNYLKAHRPDYEKLLKQFASIVVNEGMWEGEAIEQAMQLPAVLLEHIVDVFKEKNWIVVARYGSGKWEIAAGGVSPELKRWLDS
jgi:hypothetical protein